MARTRPSGSSSYNASSSSNVSQTITAATLSVTSTTITPTAGVDSGTVVLATVTDTDPSLATTDFSASVDWWDDSAIDTPTSSNGGIVHNTDGTFSIKFNHTYIAYGEYPVHISVTDNVNTLSASTTTTANVADPISLTNPGDQTGTEGDTISLTLSATDSTSGTITYGAEGLPPGLYLNPTTGAITGDIALGAHSPSPASGEGGEGVYTVTIFATNGNYIDSKKFTWTVASPVTISSIADQSSVEGDTISLSVSASDSISGSTLSYAAIGLPDGLKINTSTGAITGTVAPGAAVAGPYTVTVIAGDNTYFATRTFVWSIASPVTIDAIADQTSLEGDTISLSISAADATSGTLSFTATGLPDGLSIDPDTGDITGVIAPGTTHHSPLTTTLTANDGTYSSSQSFKWAIASPVKIAVPADQTNVEGNSVSLTISATDSTSATITYGAIGLPAGLSINPSTGAITGTVSAGAAANGPYTVTLFASDGTYTDQAVFQWTVTSPVAIAAVADQTNVQGDSVSLTMSATDSTSGTPTWSATGLPPGVSINSSTGVISGTLTAGGDFSPVITADDGTYSAKIQLSWQVSSTITLARSASKGVYNAGDAVTVSITATNTASGTLSFSATGLPTGLSIDSSTGLISGTISSSLSPGHYTSTITVTDGTNSAVMDLPWTIYPASEVILTSPGDQNSTEGSAISTLALSSSYTGTGTLVYAAQNLPPGLVLDPATGEITGTPTAGASQFGPYEITITATDGTGFDSQYFTWTIASPISLTNPGTENSTEGDSISLSLSASYSGSGALKYAALGLPAGLSLEPATGDITGTLPAGAQGAYSITVLASADGFVTSQTFAWNIASPITISAISDQTNTEGETIATLSVSASDSISGSTLHYSALNLPAGLKIDPDTGDITGTVAVGQASQPAYTVTIIVENGNSSASVDFTWTITSPVTITTPDDQSSTEGDTFSLSLSATDSISGATLKYTALNLPPGLVINPNTGAITGSIQPGAGANGPYTVTVMAADGTYSAQTTFQWSVQNPITITSIDDQAKSEADSVSLQVDADNSAGGTLEYSATNLPNGLSINSSTGLISGILSRGGAWWTKVSVTNGTYTEIAWISWSVSSTITITDPGAQANTVGDSVSLQIEATDTATGTLSYSASALPAGLSINSSTGVISGTVSSSAATNSPCSTVVTVTDGTHTAQVVVDWSISAAGPVFVENPGDQTSAAGDAIAMQVLASDLNAGTLMFAAHGLPPGLYINPYTGFLFGTIDSGAASSTPYAVSIMASDGVDTSWVDFNWTVNAAPTVTLLNPGDQFNGQGDSVSLSLTATNTGSGTLRFLAFGLPPGLHINNTTGAITGTVAMAQDSNPAGQEYMVTVIANDGTYSAVQSFAWRVTSPIAFSAVDDQAGIENDTVSLSISAADSSSGTLKFAAIGLPPGLAINPSTGAITGTIAKGAAANGPYRVKVIAVDGTYSAFTSLAWNVTSPISIATPDAQSSNEGDTVSLTISATDSNSGTLSFAAIGLPPGLSIDSATGEISGVLAIGDSNAGAYFPTIIVTDGTYFSTCSFEWGVHSLITLDNPGSQANVVGDTIALQVNATDSSSGTLLFAATGLPAGLSIDCSTGLISGTIDSSAAAIGTYITVVTAEDGSYTNTQVFTWTISAAGEVTMTTPATQANSEGDTVSLSISASNSGSGSLKYFARGLPPGVTIDPSTGDITGTVGLGAAANGPYWVRVLATNGSRSAQDDFLWTVTSPVTISEIADQSSVEGDTISLSITAADSSSGTLKFSAEGLPPGLEINKTSGEITGAVAQGTSREDAYSVIVTAADATYRATRSFQWYIASPISIADPGEQISLEGDSISLNLSASYSGSGTLKYAAIGLPPGLAIDCSTGIISGTLISGTSDTVFSSVVTASDGTYCSVRLITWKFRSPIQIANPGDQVSIAGETVHLQLSATSSVSGTPLFSAIGLPQGLSIDSQGLISGTIPDSSANVGSFLVHVRLREGNFVTDIWFTWSVLNSSLGYVSQGSGSASFPGSGTGSSTAPAARSQMRAAELNILAVQRDLKKATDPLVIAKLNKELTGYQLKVQALDTELRTAELYGGKSGPDYLSITEEWEGKPHTCWLLSSIASIASKSPSSVDTLFRVAISGGWQVSVDGRWYTVPTLSDAELKKYTTSNGAWVAYYEAGYREWLKDPKAPKDVRDYNDKESKNEKDLLDNRRYFEGVKAIFRYLSPDFADGWKPESQLIEEKVWNKDRRWIEVLITSLTDTGSRASLAVAATMLESDERDTIEGLHKHHGYTILGFADKNFQLVTDPDQEKKVQYIKLYNSFAYHLKAFPPEGRKMGWDPKHKANTAAYGTPQFPEEIGDTKQPGVFYMPITDFTRLFGAVIYVGPKMNKN